VLTGARQGDVPAGVSLGLSDFFDVSTHPTTNGERERLNEAVESLRYAIGLMRDGLRVATTVVDVSVDTQWKNSGCCCFGGRRTVGYVNRWTAHRRIHMDFEWISLDRVSMELVAQVLIHEASHKWAATRDNAYFDLQENQRPQITLDEKLANADHVAWMIQKYYVRMNAEDRGTTAQQLRAIDAL
jgi:hypothetical protein